MDLSKTELPTPYGHLDLLSGAGVVAVERDSALRLWFLFLLPQLQGHLPLWNAICKFSQIIFRFLRFCFKLPRMPQPCIYEGFPRMSKYWWLWSRETLLNSFHEEALPQTFRQLTCLRKSTSFRFHPLPLASNKPQLYVIWCYMKGNCWANNLLQIGTKDTLSRVFLQCKLPVKGKELDIS